MTPSYTSVGCVAQARDNVSTLKPLGIHFFLEQLSVTSGTGCPQQWGIIRNLISEASPSQRNSPSAHADRNGFIRISEKTPTPQGCHNI